MIVMQDRGIEDLLREINAPVKARLEEIFKRRKAPFEVYGLLSEFLSTNGKLLRPALCLVSCKAVGGNPKDAVPAAAAIEMFHNFTLIHDDIEDCSQMRRGKPCMHVKYGTPLALNAGDGLFMMVWQEALRLSGDRKMAAQEKLLSSFTEVLEGQALELGWYHSNKWDVTEAEYRQVVGGKTGALIAASCEVGGMLGGGNRQECRALSEFGRGIGIGFQIVDDVLNIIGNENTYGKEIGGDVREGKRTLITIHALRTLPPAKKSRLELLLKKESKTDADVSAVVSLLKESGAPEKAMAAAESIINNARTELAALPDNRAKKTLLQLADYITRRER